MRSTAGSRALAPKRIVKRYLTTGKVGEMLEVSPAAIKKWIQQGKETRAMEAGADGFLSKPFAVDAVRGLLARLFGPRR